MEFPNEIPNIESYLLRLESNRLAKELKELGNQALIHLRDPPIITEGSEFDSIIRRLYGFEALHLPDSRLVDSFLEARMHYCYGKALDLSTVNPEEATLYALEVDHRAERLNRDMSGWLTTLQTNIMRTEDPKDFQELFYNLSKANGAVNLSVEENQDFYPSIETAMSIAKSHGWGIKNFVRPLFVSRIGYCMDQADSAKLNGEERSLYLSEAEAVAGIIGLDISDKIGLVVPSVINQLINDAGLSYRRNYKRLIESNNHSDLEELFDIVSRSLDSALSLAVKYGVNLDRYRYRRKLQKRFKEFREFGERVSAVDKRMAGSVKAYIEQVAAKYQFVNSNGKV